MRAALHRARRGKRLRRAAVGAAHVAGEARRHQRRLSVTANPLKPLRVVVGHLVPRARPRAPARRRGQHGGVGALEVGALGRLVDGVAKQGGRSRRWDRCAARSEVVARVSSEADEHRGGHVLRGVSVCGAGEERRAADDGACA
eukprot:6189165-Pleurochrysis_carterae.AAC.1